MPRFLRRMYRSVKNRVRGRWDMFQARRSLMPDLVEGERVGRIFGQIMIPVTIFGFGGMMTLRTHQKVADRIRAETEPRGPRSG